VICHGTNRKFFSPLSSGQYQALQEATQSTNFGQFFLAEGILVELVNLHPQLLESLIFSMNQPQKVSRKIHPVFRLSVPKKLPFRSVGWILEG